MYSLILGILFLYVTTRTPPLSGLARISRAHCTRLFAVCKYFFAVFSQSFFALYHDALANRPLPAPHRSRQSLLSQWFDGFMETYASHRELFSQSGAAQDEFHAPM
jgi:hypothetical protein